MRHGHVDIFAIAPWHSQRSAIETQHLVHCVRHVHFLCSHTQPSISIGGSYAHAPKLLALEVQPSTAHGRNDCSFLDARLRSVRQDSHVTCFSLFFLLSWRSVRSACLDTGHCMQVFVSRFSDDSAVRRPCTCVQIEKTVG